MKLLTFRHLLQADDHFGVLLSDGHILDINAAAKSPLVPASLLACIRDGTHALERVRDMVALAEDGLARGDATHLVNRNAVFLRAPLAPGKIMAIGKNYAAHAAEIGEGRYSRPSGFIKNSDTVIADGDTIVKPGWTATLDYENELAVVISDRCTQVPAEEAYAHVFGYTIMVDMSARDVQYAERKEGNIMIGKNFPTAAPLGPWVVTRDEIEDPHNLRIVTKVNGEIRQDSSTALQIFQIPQQIAWYSHAGLRCGDIISTGSPGGTGAGYEGPGTWYLQDGDRLECEIGGIGVLRNTVAWNQPTATD